MRQYVKAVWMGAVILMIMGMAGSAALGADDGEDDRRGAYRGTFEFTPSIEASFRHDDNYYLEDVQEVSVNSYVVTPGFDFGYTTPQSKLKLDYFFSANQYTGDDRVDDDDYYGHTLELLAQTQATDHFLVGLQENYTKSRINGALNDLGAEVNREKYQFNNISSFVTYTFNEKWGMDFKYANKLVDYNENLNEDSDENRGEFDLSYHLTPTALIKVDYNIWHQDYDRSTPDYVSQQAGLTLEKEYQLFFISAAVGYHNRSFSGSAQSDFDDVVWNLSLYGESANARYMIGIDRNFNDFGQDQQYYTGMLVETLLGYLFAETLDVQVEFSYQDRNFIAQNRNDDIYQFKATLTYIFTKQFSTSVEYGYEKRDSNLSTQIYDNNFVMVGAKFKFDVSNPK